MALDALADFLDGPARRDRVLILRGAAVLPHRQPGGLRQTPGHRRYSKALQVLGATGCIVLVATLPASSIAAGLGVFAGGIAYRLYNQSAAAMPLTRTRPAALVPTRTGGSDHL